MRVNNCYTSLDILETIENFKIDLRLERNSGILLTSLKLDGSSEKKIFSQNNLTEPGLNLSCDLTKYISDIINSRKSIGFVHLKSNLDIGIIHIVEVIQLKRIIVILGAGHVGRCLSLIASLLGFEVILMDDREEFLSDIETQNYSMKKVLSTFNNYLESIWITSNCAVVIVTRGHQYDEICLYNAISTKAKYIGMIGSKRRVLAITDNLRKKNLSSEQLIQLQNIFAPIGLDIRAKTPQEIAVSILAQIIQVMN